VTERVLADSLARVRAGFIPTPVVRLAHDRVDLFAKLEFANPNGSVKDRSAFYILEHAIKSGELTPGSTVVESSSGNFAISLASFCRALHIDFVPVIDPNTNRSTERLLDLACRHVERVTERDTQGGYLRNRLVAVQRLLAMLDDGYWPDQYGNRHAADAHDEMTGAELCQVFDRIDYVFVGVGTGATIAGLSRRLKRAMPRIRVVAVDAVGSVSFGSEPGRRHIPGIGSSIRPPLLEQAQIDDVVMVPEADTVRACHRLVTQHGVFAGGSSGSVYAAIDRYFEGYHGRPPVVVFLCADRGTAYADTVYRSGWLTAANAGLGDLAAVSPPARLP
jgi:2,3-diaminopropionate biosynthesis protein SbnA